MTGISKTPRPNRLLQQREPTWPPARPRLLPFLGATALLLAACAQTASPTVPADAPAGSRALNCPTAQARFLTCGNAVRLVSYDERLKLDDYCTPMAGLEASFKGSARTRPIQTLSDGTRAMFSGAAGWLLLPKEASIVEAPAAVTVWWRDRQCSFPTSLRASAPGPGPGR